MSAYFWCGYIKICRVKSLSSACMQNFGNIGHSCGDTEPFPKISVAAVKTYNRPIGMRYKVYKQNFTEIVQGEPIRRKS